MPILEFKGKDKIYNHWVNVPVKRLDIDREKSMLGSTLQDNLIIHSDNLIALKSLLLEYKGKIDCVYIDPPYNTGNKSWLYNDNMTNKLMREYLETVVEREDLDRHDKWLCMMYPRLYLLNKLLKDTGTILVSIDDNEGYNLKLMMDEIFGERNFVTNLTWIKKDKTSGAPSKRKLSFNREHILVYSKDKKFAFKGVPGSLKSYKKDKKGRYWRDAPIQSTLRIGGNQFAITNPENGNQHYGRWAFTEKTIESMILENKIIFPEKESQKPRQLMYYDKDKKSPIFQHLGLFSSEVNTKHLWKLFPDLKFDYSKPLDLIKFLLDQITDKNALILDAFAGSGTTGHAALELNNEDKGNRKFILIESEEYIDTLTAERIRRVIKNTGSNEKLAFCKLI